MDQVIYRLNDGLTNLRFQTNSVILKNHLIFSFAFSKFYEHYRQGRGKIYAADTRLQEYALIGYLTEIVYWFFHERVC